MARNDYIMSLAAANAHMTRYYCKEMQDIMSVSYLPLFKILYSFWSKDFHLTGLLIFRGKKSKISRDFQGQTRGKIGRFCRNFAGEKSNFAEKPADFAGF